MCFLLSLYRSDIPLVGKEDENLATPLRDSPMGAANSLFHSRHNSSKNGSIDYGSINSNVIPGSSHASSSRRKNHSLYHNTSNAHQHHKGLESVATASCGVTDCNCNGDSAEHSKSCAAAAAASPYQNKDVVKEFRRKSRSSVSPTSAYVSNAFPSTSAAAQQIGFDLKKNKHLTNETTAQPDNDNTSNSPKQQATSHSLTRSNFANSSGKVVTEKALLRLHLESQQETTMEAQDVLAEGTPPCIPKLMSSESGRLDQSGANSDSSPVSLDIANTYEEETDDDEEVCGSTGGETVKLHPVTKPPKARALTPPPPLKPRERARNSSPMPTLPDSCYKSSQLSPTGKNGLNATKTKLSQNQQSVGEERPKPKLTLPFVNINDMTIIENRTYDLAGA